ncbi:hypothetical protein L1887_42576 [Cichorium endivia]|nr:hypothetical protein L1887_42576 [Cichorium endivia]
MRRMYKKQDQVVMATTKTPSNTLRERERVGPTALVLLGLLLLARPWLGAGRGGDVGLVCRALLLVLLVLLGRLGAVGLVLLGLLERLALLLGQLRLARVRSRSRRGGLRRSHLGLPRLLERLALLLGQLLLVLVRGNLGGCGGEHGGCHAGGSSHVARASSVGSGVVRAAARLHLEGLLLVAVVAGGVPCGAHAGHAALHLERTQARLELGARLDADGGRALVALGLGIGERVEADGERGLGGDHARHLTLELLWRLADERGVVDEAVLGRVVLGLERAEERLFGAEDLHGRGRVLGEVHERAGVADEACADEVADEGGEVGRDGGHAVLEVLVELGAVLGDGDDLVAQAPDVLEVGVGDLGAHGDLGGGLEGEVVGDDLAHLGEVPAVPLLDAHGVDVDLLVEVVEEADGLDHHGVHLVRAELELVATQGVGEAEAHGVEVARVERLAAGGGGEERGEVLADAAVEVEQLRVVGDLDAELLCDGGGELGLGDDEVLLVLALCVDDLVGEELFEALAHLALVDGRDVLDGLGGVGEAVDGGELEEVGGALGRVERLVEVLGGLELGRVRHVEEAEAHGGLEEYLDHGDGGSVALRPLQTGEEGWMKARRPEIVGGGGLDSERQLWRLCVLKGRRSEQVVVMVTVISAGEEELQTRFALHSAAAAAAHSALQLCRRESTKKNATRQTLLAAALEFFSPLRRGVQSACCKSLNPKLRSLFPFFSLLSPLRSTEKREPSGKNCGNHEGGWTLSGAY